jgi:16S rRNA (cytidine1402-2'-O)-methyltransferase
MRVTTGRRERLRCSVILSKLFEENARGTVDELIAHFSAKQVEGEIVVVLAGEE